MNGRITVVATALVALIAAGCGSGNKSGTGTSTRARVGKACTASVGFEGPISGSVAAFGQEQLAFAKLAVSNDNNANRTNITLVPGDTELTPSLATMVAAQFISNSRIVAVVGPASSPEVEAVGTLFGRAGLGFISGSATETALTDGSNPTFFRVVPTDSTQGPEDARYIVRHLHPKAVMIVDDQDAYSTALASSMVPIFKAAGITVDHQSISHNVTDFSSLVTKVTPQMSVVVLPWQVPANREQFAKNLAAQHRKATIFGTGGLQAPSFTIPGSYVSAFGPDIRSIPGDTTLVSQAKAAYPKFGTFGPPVYAAAHVVDKAVARVCKSGQTPGSSNVLAAIKATNETTSALGQAIRFNPHGDLIGAKWFLFKVSSAGHYRLISNTRSG